MDKKRLTERIGIDTLFFCPLSRLRRQLSQRESQVTFSVGVGDSASGGRTKTITERLSSCIFLTREQSVNA